MRVLLLSFYFEPDLSAGSFRATALVEALKPLLPAGSSIEVLTTYPNRYQSFSPILPDVSEEISSCVVHRFAIPPHTGGMLSQAKAFFAYFKQVRHYTKNRDYDLVVATSSRLMTAVLGAVVARRKAVLYLDIRDLFVDTIKDVLPRGFSLVAKVVFSLLERWVVRKAYKINLVSKGFSAYFQQHYPNSRVSFFTNGIDKTFIAAAPLIAEKHAKTTGVLTVLYAGNIGEGQGLHRILPVLAKQMQTKVHFRVVGDGGRKQALENALRENEVNNVELLPPMNREQLLTEYQRADVLFLHLNDYDAFKKVLPSKLFEYAALGKPIWAGVSGYAAEFIRAEIDNAVYFAPGNAEEAEQVFSRLEMRIIPRNEFMHKYSRSNIMHKMVEDMMLCITR